MAIMITSNRLVGKQRGDGSFVQYIIQFNTTLPVTPHSKHATLDEFINIVSSKAWSPNDEMPDHDPRV